MVKSHYRISCSCIGTFSSLCTAIQMKYLSRFHYWYWYWGQQTTHFALSWFCRPEVFQWQKNICLQKLHKTIQKKKNNLSAHSENVAFSGVTVQQTFLFADSTDSTQCILYIQLLQEDKFYVYFCVCTSLLSMCQKIEDLKSSNSSYFLGKSFFFLLRLYICKWERS